MRRSVLIWLAMAACPVGAEARSFHWPWSRTAEQQERKDDQQEQQQERKKMRLFPLFSNSRAKEQERLNAATAPKPTTREEQVLKPDYTKEFNPSVANFGSGRSITGKNAATNAFHFVDRTRTKSFATGAFATKQAWGSDSQFATKSVETKQSWFAKLTSPTKTYATRESRDANTGLQGRTLPGSEKRFVAIGRRQAALDKGGGGMMPIGGEREGGQSWSGELKPMSIQDVKSLLNKN